MSSMYRRVLRVSGSSPKGGGGDEGASSVDAFSETTLRIHNAKSTAFAGEIESGSLWRLRKSFNKKSVEETRATAGDHVADYVKGILNVKCEHGSEWYYKALLLIEVGSTSEARVALENACKNDPSSLLFSSTFAWTAPDDNDGGNTSRSCGGRPAKVGISASTAMPSVVHCARRVVESVIQKARSSELSSSPSGSPMRRHAADSPVFGSSVERQISTSSHAGGAHSSASDLHCIVLGPSQIKSALPGMIADFAASTNHFSGNAVTTVLVENDSEELQDCISRALDYQGGSFKSPVSFENTALWKSSVLGASESPSRTHRPSNLKWSQAKQRWTTYRKKRARQNKEYIALLPFSLGSLGRSIQEKLVAQCQTREAEMIIIDFDSDMDFLHTESCPMHPKLACMLIDQFEGALQLLHKQVPKNEFDSVSLEYVSWMFAKLQLDGERFQDGERPLKSWLALLNKFGYEAKEIVSGDRLGNYQYSADSNNNENDDAVPALLSKLFVLHASPMSGKANRIQRIPSGCEHHMWM